MRKLNGKQPSLAGRGMAEASFNNFREFIEAAYFRGSTAFQPVIEMFRDFHRQGVVSDEYDIEFLNRITSGLNKLNHANDLHNVVTLLAADAIYDDLHGSPDTRRHNTQITRIVDALSAADSNSTDHRPNNHVTQNELVRFLSLYLPHRMDEYIGSHALPESLPLIDHMAERLESFGRPVSVLVGIQHLFGSTIPLIRALVAKGIHKDGVFLLGKPYSSSHHVYWSLKRDYYVHPGSLHYTGELEYHKEALAHVEAVLLKAINRLQSSAVDPESLALVLDDGGLLIRKLHEPAFDHIRHRFVCVEQTTRGLIELSNTVLKEGELKVPVVNVAASRAKLVYESPIIAASVKAELSRMIAQLKDSGIEISRKALVIGYGSIGKSVARMFIEAGWEVGVFDNAPEKLDSAVNETEGLAVHHELLPALAKYQVIIGCTGQNSFSFGHIKHLQDNAILVSASSSDIEFSAWEMRGLAMAMSNAERYTDKFNLIYEKVGSNDILLGDPDHPCHFLYVVRAYGKTIFLCNGGFPVNMPGSIDPIDVNQIQLTRSLLYAAAIQATHERGNGLIDLKEASQQEILLQFDHLNRK